MKTNSTLIVVVRIIAFVLLCLYSLLVFGQAEPVSVRKTTPLQSFTGVMVKDNSIKLMWVLTTGNTASTITVEKGNTAASFQAQAEFWVNMEGNFQTEFKWSDRKVSKESSYYRLKITDDKGNITYSDILQLDQKKGLTFYNPAPEASTEIASL